VFVEDVVGREQALGIACPLFPVDKHHGPVLQRRTGCGASLDSSANNHCRPIFGCSGEFFDGRFLCGEHAVAVEQVPWRIAEDSEFRGNDEVRTSPCGLFDAIEEPIEIVGHVADHRVVLEEANAKRSWHSIR